MTNTKPAVSELPATELEAIKQRCEKATAELASAKDTARLDWLASNECQLGWPHPQSPLIYRQFTLMKTGRFHHGLTLREVIDAAIASGEGKGGK